jgi:hypothetical protein
MLLKFNKKTKMYANMIWIMIVGSKDIHNQLTNKTYTSLCFILYTQI